MIYHVLGSDIPHHNHTLLGFFQGELSDLCGEARFYVVGKPTLAQAFPLLNIRTFPSKKAIAKALIQLSKSEPAARYFFHGQYNLFIWLALLVGLIPAQQCHWHVWGADLYEESPSLSYRLFYPLRRLAQRKLARIYATEGDLQFMRQLLKRHNPADQRLYFPTKMPKLERQVGGKKAIEGLTILLGNSGDPTNQHLQALDLIHQQLGEQVKLYLPMGYPAHNDAYIEQVRQKANRLFPAENLQILTEPLPFEDYLELLQQVDLGYFHFPRQQGIGTICLLTALNIPIALHPNNPFYIDLQSESVSCLLTNQISLENIVRIKSELQKIEKGELVFFPKGYTRMWREILKGASSHH